MEMVSRNVYAGHIAGAFKSYYGPPEVFELEYRLVLYHFGQLGVGLFLCRYAPGLDVLELAFNPDRVEHVVCIYGFIY